MNRLDQLRKRFDQAVAAAAENPAHALPEWTDQVSPEQINDLDFILCGSGVWAATFLHYARPGKVLAVVDDNHAGRNVLGHPCIGTDDWLKLLAQNPKAVCVNSGQSNAGYSHFERLGNDRGARMLNYLQALRTFRITTDIRVGDWLAPIVKMAEGFRTIESFFCDEFSRETLYSVLLFHLETDRDFLLPLNRPPDAGYFQSGFFSVGPDETYVDCGAYTGDSVEAFLQACHGRFRKIHAFEPDPANFRQLQGWYSGLRIESDAEKIALHSEAVSNESGTIAFQDGGQAGSCIPFERKDRKTEIETSGVEVPVVTLDEAIREPISLLKLDIEGQELKALKGASGHLRQTRPNLAVCAYHLPTDLIDLPTFIAGMDKGYRIGIRHHSNVRYDTILYAF